MNQKKKKLKRLRNLELHMILLATRSSGAAGTHTRLEDKPDGKNVLKKLIKDGFYD